MLGRLNAGLEKIHRFGEPLFRADVFHSNKEALIYKGLEAGDVTRTIKTRSQNTFPGLHLPPSALLAEVAMMERVQFLLHLFQPLLVVRFGGVF